MKYLYFEGEVLFLVSSMKQDNNLVELIVDDSFIIDKKIELELDEILYETSVDKTYSEILQDIDYITLRKIEYSKLNQFEMQFNDEMNGTTTWIDAINDIKTKYPKPE